MRRSLQPPVPGFIILHLGVNVHSNLAVFVACQVLNSLRINLGVDQVRDVGMTELVRRNLEVHAVGNLAVMRGNFSEHRRDRM